MEDKDRVREFSAGGQQSGKLFLIVRGGNSSLSSAFCLGRQQLQLFCFKPPIDCTITTSTRRKVPAKIQEIETCLAFRRKKLWRGKFEMGLYLQSLILGSLTKGCD